MAIRFYSWPRSSGSRVHWALEELGVPYEYVRLDRAKGEHKTPAYLAINPNGKVPALVDDGVAYFESLAITLHLGERYGAERALWPSGGQERADALSWSAWSVTELGTYLLRFIYHGLDSPISYKAEDRSKAAAAFNRSQLDRHIAMLGERLATREHICGAFTLVDVLASSTLRFGTMMGVAIEGQPAVMAWLDRVTKRPALANIE